jgi:hypothetical protein
MLTCMRCIASHCLSSVLFSCYPGVLTHSAISCLVSVTQAYLDGLDKFVDAVGIKKPFAVVVQVRHLAAPGMAAAGAMLRNGGTCSWRSNVLGSLPSTLPPSNLWSRNIRQSHAQDPDTQALRCACLLACLLADLLACTSAGLCVGPVRSAICPST